MDPLIIMCDVIIYSFTVLGFGFVLYQIFEQDEK